jgi:hypothetical protein
MKFLLIIWGLACIAFGGWLYLEFDIFWGWAGFLAFALFTIMLMLLDWVSERVNIFMPLRDRMVDGWRQAHKWWSVRLMAAAGTVELLEYAIRKAWLDLPPAILGVVPADLLSKLSVLLLVLGIIARMVKQKEPASP